MSDGKDLHEFATNADDQSQSQSFICIENITCDLI